jgi:hypothetical protein
VRPASTASPAGGSGCVAVMATASADGPGHPPQLGPDLRVRIGLLDGGDDSLAHARPQRVHRRIVDDDDGDIALPLQSHLGLAWVVEQGWQTVPPAATLRSKAICAAPLWGSPTASHRLSRTFQTTATTSI